MAPTLKRINDEAGTNFKTWKELVNVLSIANKAGVGIPAQWEPPRVYEPVKGQMLRVGFQFRNGYPVKRPPGPEMKTYSTNDVDYKYDDEGNLFLAYERTTFEQLRDVRVDSIYDQPLVLEDGKPAECMFWGHIWWMRKWGKTDEVINVDTEIADKCVAWFRDGKVFYTSTFGELLDLSIAFHALNSDTLDDLWIRAEAHARGDALESSENAASDAPKPEPSVDTELPAKPATAAQGALGDALWQPQWSKPKYSRFRELQNIPEHWKIERCVMVWRTADRQELRVFGAEGMSLQMGSELLGPGPVVETHSSPGRRDYMITRVQYEQASRSA